MAEEFTWGQTIMKRIAILVEGESEEKFVTELLVPHFLKFDLYITPIIVETKRLKSGKKFSGGYVSYSKIKNELLRLLNSYDFVTTLFDYYGLNDKFPDYKKSLKVENIYTKVKIVEEALEKDIRNRKMIAYLQMHEFETLLFSSIKGFEEEYFEYPEKILQINNIIEEYLNPEEINNSKETAPSKRIEAIFGENYFKKTLNGISIAKSIGLEIMRDKCKHFDQWLTKLEKIN